MVSLVESGVLNSVARPVLYKRRWTMLLVSFLLNLVNSAVWDEVAVVQDQLESIYNVDSDSIILLTSLVYVIYVPGTILSVFLFGRVGLKTTSAIGGILIAAACWARALALRRRLFEIEIVASCVYAVGQPLILNGCSMFSSLWMAPWERAFSTMLYETVPANLGGALLSLIVSGRFHSETNVFLYFCAVASCVTAVLLLYVAVMRETPPTPPEHPIETPVESADTITEFLANANRHTGNGRCDTARTLLNNSSFLSAALAVVVTMGMICCVPAVVTKIFAGKSLGYTEDFADNLNSVYLLTGIAGAVVLAPLCDWLKTMWVGAAKWAMFSLLAMASFSAISITLNAKPGNPDGITVSVGVMSFFNTACLPIAIEAGAEAGCPVACGTSAGIMLMIANLFGWVSVQATEVLLKVSSTAPMWFYAVALAIASATVLLYKPQPVAVSMTRTG